MVDNAELQAERDANIQGVPEKDQTWVFPKYKAACMRCIDKKMHICLLCQNFQICESKEMYPGCWVGEKCKDCEEK